MVGVRMPSEEELPPGPKRDLVAALHVLYTAAGKPAMRTLSMWIGEQDDLPGTLSQQGVSDALRGKGTTRWLNLESLVRVLAARQRVSRLDSRDVLTEIHTLWSRATGTTETLTSPSSASAQPLVPEAAEHREPLPSQTSGSPAAQLKSPWLRAVLSDAEREAEIYRRPSTAPIPARATISAAESELDRRAQQRQQLEDQACAGISATGETLPTFDPAPPDESGSRQVAGPGKVLIPELGLPGPGAYRLAQEASELAAAEERELILRTTPTLWRGYGRSR